MSRPQKYPDNMIESVLTRRKAGELIEDIAKDIGMECKTLTRLINRRHGNIRKAVHLNSQLMAIRKKEAKSRPKKQVKKFTLRIEEKYYEQLKSMAEQDDKTIAEVIAMIIQRELGERE